MLQVIFYCDILAGPPLFISLFSILLSISQNALGVVARADHPLAPLTGDEPYGKILLPWSWCVFIPT